MKMEKSTSFLDFFGITHNFRIQKDNNCQNKLIKKSDLLYFCNEDIRFDFFPFIHVDRGHGKLLNKVINIYLANILI